MLNEEEFYAHKHESEKFYKLAKCIENDTLQMKAKKNLERFQIEKQVFVFRIWKNTKT